MAMGKTLTVYLAADVSKLRRGLDDADNSLTGFGKKLSGMVGPALIGAAAAAGAFAVSMAVDGVQAAMQEEAELAKLSNTIDNLGFSASTDELNAFVDSMQYSVGISDSELRPSLSRLLVATKDVSEAQRLLALSTDVAAGTGRTLEQTTNAIAKAAEGNFGALNKLGAGIDSTTIKNKDFDAALRQLSGTFEGAAATSANTLQGKIKILGIAFDELKESFGKGFLDGLMDGSGAIGGLTDNMRDLQPAMEDIGKSLGDLTTKIIESLGWIAKIDQATNQWGDNLTLDIAMGLIQFGDLLGIVSDEEAAKADADYAAAKSADVNAAATNNQANALLNLASIQANMDKYVRGGYGGIPTSQSFHTQDTWIQKFKDMKVAAVQTSRATGGVTAAAKEMDPALRRQIDLVKELTGKVGDAGKALENARKEMNSWIDSMAGNILSGIDLGTIQEFDEAGKRTGKSLLEGFDYQIQQAGLFGNYLKRLNSEGGPELRDAVAALGPEAGNKLAEEIIKNGLIPTMQSRLVDVQSMAETTAAEMVPPMLVAGVASASGYLIKMQNELDASTSMLEEMGRKMGKTLSEAMVEEIRAALAAAGVAQAGAANVQAGLPADALSVQAQVAQRIDNPFMNSTAIMLAIQRAIADSDQRLGRTGQVVLQ